MDNLRLYNQNKGLSVLLTFAFGPFGLLYTKKWIWSLICIGMYSFMAYDLIINFDFDFFLLPTGILSKIIDLNLQNALHNTRDVQDMGVMIGIWILSMITSYDWVVSLEKKEDRRSERINSNNNKTMENQSNNSDEICVLRYELKKKKTWLALLLSLFLGPIGLIYTGRWLTPLLLTIGFWAQPFLMVKNAINIDLFSLPVNISYMIGFWILGVIFAPILVKDYNSELLEEMNAKNKNENKEEN